MSEYWVEDALFSDPEPPPAYDEVGDAYGQLGLFKPPTMSATQESLLDLPADTPTRRQEFWQAALEGGGAANITQLSTDQYSAPTSTTNPARPRTLAAKWRPEDQTMIVMMRDGKKIAYPGIGRVTWNNFRSAISKGAWLLANVGEVRLGSLRVNWYESDDDDVFWHTVAPFIESDHPNSGEQRRYGGVEAGQSKNSTRRREAHRAIRSGRRVSDVMGYVRQRDLGR